MGEPPLPPRLSLPPSATTSVAPAQKLGLFWALQLESCQVAGNEKRIIPGELLAATHLSVGPPAGVT